MSVAFPNFLTGVNSATPNVTTIIPPSTASANVFSLAPAPSPSSILSATGVFPPPVTPAQPDLDTMIMTLLSTVMSLVMKLLDNKTPAAPAQAPSPATAGTPPAGTPAAANAPAATPAAQKTTLSKALFDSIPQYDATGHTEIPKAVFEATHPPGLTFDMVKQFSKSLNADGNQGGKENILESESIRAAIYYIETHPDVNASADTRQSWVNYLWDLNGLMDLHANDKTKDPKNLGGQNGFYSFMDANGNRAKEPRKVTYTGTVLQRP